MIDLATWNLTIPVGVPATIISTQLLVGGYQDHYFQSDAAKIFFWAPVNGSTTSNASYPRSELRETFADGKLRNWNYPSADNYLSATLKVTQVPSSGRMVIGQIHGYKNDKPMLKLEYEYKASTASGTLVAKVRMIPDGNVQTIKLASGISLNQELKYSIHLTPNGTLGIIVNSAKWSARLNQGWATHLLYFKAGAYPQDNSGYETEAGSATFYNLKVEHRPLTITSN
jgi:hypothetical protein